MPIDNSSRFPKPLAADLLELSEGMAIVIDGDTAPKAITAGQYLFIKNHSTLATGGYHATAAIASGAAVTSSNVAADPNGIVNGAVSALNGNLADKTAVSPITSNKTGLSGYRFGRVAVITGTNVTHPSAISTDTKIATVSVPANQQAFGYGKTLTTKEDVFVFIITNGDVFVSGLTPVGANVAFYFTIAYITAS